MKFIETEQGFININFIVRIEHKHGKRWAIEYASNGQSYIAYTEDDLFITDGPVKDADYFGP